MTDFPLFKSAIDHSRTPTVITDNLQDDNPIIYCNKAFEDLTGYTQEEIIGKNCRFLQGEDTNQTTRAQMRHAVKNSQSIEIMVKNYRKNGEFFWNHLLMSPLENDQGVITHFVGMQQDMTENKNLLEYKDAFIDIASHELKTPLTSLLLYSDILLIQMAKKNEGAALTSAKVIQNDIKRLTNLMNSLLNVSRIEKGKLNLVFESFNINELINDVSENFLMTNNSHAINKTLEEPAYVKGDPDKLSQVLINLITNAVKFSPDSQEISITTKPLNGKTLVSVTDYGYGIPEDEQQNIFERFYRTKIKDKSQVPGFGLGLYIANRILKEHGSILKIESQEGKGSTFSFLI